MFYTAKCGCCAAQRELRVHSLHAADCSTRVAVRFWGTVAIGDSGRACRAATIAAHLLPRSRRSCLRDGCYGQRTLRRRAHAAPAACPFGQSLRAITTVTISADFASARQLRPCRRQHRPAVDCGCCRNPHASPLRSPRTAFFLLRLARPAINAGCPIPREFHCGAWLRSNRSHGRSSRAKARRISIVRQTSCLTKPGFSQPAKAEFSKSSSR